MRFIIEHGVEVREVGEGDSLVGSLLQDLCSCISTSSAVVAASLTSYPDQICARSTSDRASGRFRPGALIQLDGLDFR
jgi:hypothetical protein